MLKQVQTSHKQNMFFLLIYIQINPAVPQCGKEQYYIPLKTLQINEPNSK